ncbi:MAG: hypothetical protein JW782_06520 [Candidatus Saganbacteria bacterium]|nr:hypothetical protein [Candidatus Saganbacteria bacterium]
MKKLPDPETRNELRPTFRQMIRELNQRHGLRHEKLTALGSPAALKEFISAEIAELLPGSSVSFEAPNALSPAAAVAAQQGKAIEIPARQSSKIYVSVSPSKITDDVFEATPKQLSITDSALPNGAGSLIVAPILLGPEKELSCLGALTISRTSPNAFRQNLDIRLVARIANDMAVALSQANQTL